MKYFSDVNSKVDFKSICFEECLNSNYIKPTRMVYIENGKRKVWDIINSYDSVSILLFNRDFDSFLIVRQFRPAVYANNQDGYTYELCAGLIDKEGKTLEQIASEEIFEECGYDVKADDLEKIGSFFASTGISGSKQTIFFATISEENKINGGGGIDDECIDVLFLPLREAQKFIDDDSMVKTPSLAYAIKWHMDKFK